MCIRDSYGIALSGWSSNNKYSLFGSLRATAQVISYELALGLSLVGVVLRAQSLSLRDIVNSQGCLLYTSSAAWRRPLPCCWWAATRRTRLR